jgi:hypothetical protein
MAGGRSGGEARAEGGLRVLGGGDRGGDGVIEVVVDVVPSDVGHAAHGHDMGSGGLGSGDAAVVVLDDEAFARGDAEAFGGVQVNLRRGFGEADVLVAHEGVEVFGEGGLAQHELDAGAHGVGDDGKFVAADLQVGDGVFVGGIRTAARVDDFEGVALLELVDKAVKRGRETLLAAEHFEFFAGREAVKGDEVVVTADAVAELGEGAVERFVVPVLGLDEHAFHVEYDCFDHDVLSWVEV